MPLIQKVVAAIRSLKVGVTAYPLSSPSNAEKLSVPEYYRIFREYRIAEHNLVNSRLTWNITLQGFLFATYGFSIQKLAELQTSYLASQSFAKTTGVFELKVLLYLIPVVGCLLSFFVWLSVFAATLSLHNLKVQWIVNVEGKDRPAPFKPLWAWISCCFDRERKRQRIHLVPDPAGSGSDFVLALGLGAPFAIPLVFMFAWIVLYRFLPPVSSSFQQILWKVFFLWSWHSKNSW